MEGPAGAERDRLGHGVGPMVEVSMRSAGVSVCSSSHPGGRGPLRFVVQRTDTDAFARYKKLHTPRPRVCSRIPGRWISHSHT